MSSCQSGVHWGLPERTVRKLGHPCLLPPHLGLHACFSYWELKQCDAFFKAVLEDSGSQPGVMIIRKYIFLAVLGTEKLLSSKLQL